MSAATLFSESIAALRSLRRAPGFTMLALAMLATGIGANVAIFSIFDSIVLSPLPYPDAAQLVAFNSINSAKALTQPALSAADFRDVHGSAQSFSALAAYRPDFSSYTPPQGDPVQVIGALVTEEFFAVFSVPPLAGRVFRAEEYGAATAPTAVISHAFWRRHFGERVDVIGATVTIDKRPTTIVGVMPDFFREPEFVDLWLPFDPQAAENLARDSRYWSTVGRLKVGATMAAAQAEAATLALAIAHENPAVNKGWTFTLAPLLEQRVGPVRDSLLLLIGAVSLVHLIACVNLANLLLARGLVRLPQFALRLALGATSGALARSVLIESVILALLGGVAGVGLATAMLTLVANQLPRGLIPRSHAIGIDGSALGFAIALALLTGAIFGSLPAWQVRRANVSELLKSAGTRGTPGRIHGRMQAGLIAAQIAITLVVLTGAASLVQHLLQLQSIAPGFDPRHVLTVRIAPGIGSWQNPAELARYYDRLIEELRRTPGIASAAMNSSAPLCGITLRYPFWVQGRPRTEGNADEAVFASATPDLLLTLKLSLVRGRFFTHRDDDRAARVCVINETFARRVFPGEDPIGKRVQTVPWLSREYREIVGIVADTRQDNLSDPPPPQLYVPSAQSPWFFTTILVRIAPGTGAATVQAALRRADPALSMSVRSLEENIAVSTIAPRLRAWLFGLFGVSALGLSAFGVYASMAFTVSQRRREIGVRAALGATPGEILRWVLARALRVSASGVGIGILGAAALAHLLRGTLPGVGGPSPAMLSGLALFLVTTALLASAHPAARAARVNPTQALRQD